jgi:hypothetical protein
MPELTSTTDATENEAVVDQPDERAEDHDSEVTSSSQEEPASLSEKNTPSLEAESVPTTSENAYDDDIKNQLSPVPEDSVPEELREDIVAVEAREGASQFRLGAQLHSSMLRRQLHNQLNRPQCLIRNSTTSR